MISGHLDEYRGLPVVSSDTDGGTGSSAGRVAWRVATTLGGPTFRDVWERFCGTVDTTEVTALVIGPWMPRRDPRQNPVSLLAEAAASFPNLRSLYLGDLTLEEAEILSIGHGDISPILRALPELECLDVRGGDGLVLEPVEHGALTMLRFESGGLPAGIVRAVGASDLPKLERLTLWLGEEYYGGDATVADLAPILSGERLPALRHLGLENAETQDEIAEAVAGAPIVARLATLSLALGLLTDRGAEALLSGQALTHLDELDLEHHFLSDAMMARVEAALPGVEVDLGDQLEPDEDEFFIAFPG